MSESTTLIESTKCPACHTDLLMEASARYKVKTFEFARGIKIDCHEIHCEIKNAWTKRDKFEEIKVDFGVYERDNMIMFA